MSLSTKFSKICSNVAADHRRLIVPALCVALLCWAQDFVLSIVLGYPRDIVRFAIWNGLYTFGFIYAYTKRASSLQEAACVFAGNMCLKLLFTTLQYLLCTFMLIWLFIPLFCVGIVAYEYVHFKLFNDPKTSNEKFVIRQSKHITDNLLILVVAAMFVIGGRNIDLSPSNDAAGSWKLYVMNIPTMLIADLLLGVAHNLSHRVPWMWNNHKIHHEYRENELTSMANFYAEPLDSALMSYSLIPNLYLSYLFGVPMWHIMDMTALSVFSHHKYTKMYMTLFYGYEFDILCDVILGWKFSEYHHHHHFKMSESQSLYGLLSDKTLSAFGDLFYDKKKYVE